MLHLASHNGSRDAFLMEQIQSAAQLAQAHPMEPLGDHFQLRGSLFAQRDHCHFNSLAAGRFENQEGKPAVSRNQTPFSGWSGVWRRHILFGNGSHYLVTPRSLDSMKCIISATSAESFNVSRICSR